MSSKQSAYQSGLPLLPLPKLRISKAYAIGYVSTLRLDQTPAAPPTPSDDTRQRVLTAIRDMVATSFKNTIDAILSFQVDDADVLTGQFRSKRQVYDFTITQAGKLQYGLAQSRTDAYQRGFNDVRFDLVGVPNPQAPPPPPLRQPVAPRPAATQPAGASGGGQKDKCVTGISCGLSCLPSTDKCEQELPPAAKQAAPGMIAAAKSLAGKAKDLALTDVRDLAPGAKKQKESKLSLEDVQGLSGEMQKTLLKGGNLPTKRLASEIGIPEKQLKTLVRKGTLTKENVEYLQGEYQEKVDRPKKASVGAELGKEAVSKAVGSVLKQGSSLLGASGIGEAVDGAREALQKGDRSKLYGTAAKVAFTGAALAVGIDPITSNAAAAVGKATVERIVKSVGKARKVELERQQQQGMAETQKSFKQLTAIAGRVGLGAVSDFRKQIGRDLTTNLGGEMAKQGVKATLSGLAAAADPTGIAAAAVGVGADVVGGVVKKGVEKATTKRTAKQDAADKSAFHDEVQGLLHKGEDSLRAVLEQNHQVRVDTFQFYHLDQDDNVVGSAVGTDGKNYGFVIGQKTSQAQAMQDGKQ